MRTLVLGDVHGAHHALKQVLDRSGIDKENDLLITLGDIADGWPYVAECVELLLPYKRIDIIGNHDDWFRSWLVAGTHPQQWSSGGIGTVKSYLRFTDNEHLWYENKYAGIQCGLNPGDIPVEHWKFFMHQNLYYHDTERNYFFVHGGWDRTNTVKRIREICPDEFFWDRELWERACSAGKDVKLKTADNFDTIFIGHTTTTSKKVREVLEREGEIIPWGSPVDYPLYRGGIWNLDTGAGWSGRLTIMDIDTKQYWQSDSVEDLYPDEVTRRKR